MLTATAYATRAEFDEVVGARPAGLADDELDRLLELASGDVDRLLGQRLRQTTGDYAGRKYDPTTLAEPYSTMLKRATIAQAQYRHTLGDKLTTFAAAGRISGPDYSVELPKNATGSTPRIGPQTVDELDGFPRSLTARARA